MDWIARNESQIWQAIPVALLLVDFVGRLLPGLLAGRLRPLAAIAAGAVLLVTVLAGGELASSRGWAMTAIAVVLVLQGVAGLSTPDEDDRSASDLLLPAALAVAALSWGSVFGVVVLTAGLVAWHGLSGGRTGVRRMDFGRMLALAPGVLLFCLGGYGARLRVSAGSSGDVEWLGLPLRGDLGTTAVFLALAIPFLVPGRFGGPTARLCGGAGAARWSGAVVMVHVVLLSALQLLFSGVEALRTVGLAAMGLALLVGAGPKRTSGQRHAAFLQGAAGLAVYGAGTGDEGAACGVALAVVAYATGATVVSLAVARAQSLGAEGSAARLMPQTTVFAWIASLSLLGAPLTLGGLATSIGLGSAVRDGAITWSRVGLGGIALLTGLVVVPLLLDLLGRGGAGEKARAAAPRGLAMPTAAGLGAAVLVATGAVPGALQFLLPHPGASLAAYPGAALSAATVAAGLVLGVILRRVLAAR